MSRFSAGQDRVSTLWIMLLTLTSVATTLALGCAMPFESLAALAALHLRRRDGLILLGLAWAANQAVGFGLLGYPQDWRTLSWGVGLGTAAIGSGLGAYAVLDRMPQASSIARAAAGFVAGFVAFKLVVLGWALVLGGVGITLSPVYSGRQFALNAAILVGLLALYHGLVRAGLPRPIRAGVANDTSRRFA